LKTKHSQWKIIFRNKFQVRIGTFLLNDELLANEIYIITQCIHIIELILSAINIKLNKLLFNFLSKTYGIMFKALQFMIK